jgi:hypothetical protein
VNDASPGSSPKAIPTSFKRVAAGDVSTARIAAMKSDLLRGYFTTVVWGKRVHAVEIPVGVELGNDMLAFDPKQVRPANDAASALGLKGAS